MSIFEFFNILILALSLTTVLITLVAYITFQVRRINQKEDDSKKGPQLESVFFKRFAPHLSREIEAQSERPIKRSKGKVYLKSVTLFAVVASALVVTFVVNSKRKASQVIVPLAEIGEKVEKLQEQGLMKRHIFEPMNTNNISISYHRDLDKKIEQEIESLGLVQIYLARFSKIKPDPEAYTNWWHFLTNRDVQFKTIDFSRDRVTQRLGQPENKLVIITAFDTADLELIKNINSLRDAGFRLILSGAIGPISGDENIEKWRNQNLGLKFQAQKSNSNSLVFRSSKSTFFNMLPGEIVVQEVQRQDFSVQAMNPERVLAFSGNSRSVFQDLDKTYETGALLTPSLGERSLWLRYPPSKKDDSESGMRSAYFFLQALNYAAGHDRVRVEAWPKGAEVAAVLSVDVEDKVENILDIDKILSAKKLPATYFCVSEIVEAFSDKNKLIKPGIEIATHGDNHDAFAGQSEEFQFKRIQTSRHSLEMLSQKSVEGFRPPYENFDGNTFSASIQNELSYLFGAQRCQALAPCRVGENLTLIPRQVRDDYALISDRTLVSPERIVQAMERDFQMVRQFGGGYFSNFHTQLFGQKQYHEVIEKFSQFLEEKNNIFIGTYKELDRWIKAKEKISVELVNVDSKKYIKVENQSTEELENINFTVFSLIDSKVKSRAPTSEAGLKCEKIEVGYYCQVLKIKAGQKVDYELN